MARLTGRILMEWKLQDEEWGKDITVGLYLEIGGHHYVNESPLNNQQSTEEEEKKRSILVMSPHYQVAIPTWMSSSHSSSVLPFHHPFRFSRLPGFLFFFLG